MRIREFVSECLLRMAGPSWTLIDPPGCKSRGISEHDMSLSLTNLSRQTGHRRSVFEEGPARRSDSTNRQTRP